MIEKIKILPLGLDHIELYLDHISRHFREYGVGGILSQPHSIHEPFKKERIRTRLQTQLNKYPHTPWQMVWGVFYDSEIVGHVEIVSQNHTSMSHRSRLGIGLEERFRGQGISKKLMDIVIAWASESKTIEWIDLDVFSQNIAAINLYKQYGFIKVGEIPDRIRVDGQSIDDIQMTLSIKKDMPDQNKAAYAVKKLSIKNLESMQYIELNNKNEKFSHSGLLTEDFDFSRLFVHLEIIPKGRRASSAHFHTLTEEMFLVLEGNPTIHIGDDTFDAKPGDFIGFPSGCKQFYFIENKSDEIVKVLGICSDHPLDQVQYR